MTQMFDCHGAPHVPPLEPLLRLRQRGHMVRTVIDVGAADGQWSARTNKIFPEASYLLIEANECHRSALEACTRFPRVYHVMAAAGDHVGSTNFVAGGNPFAGTSLPESIEGSVGVPCTTIDHEVQQRNLPAPYLIKIDTHGMEREIIAGAAGVLAQTEALIIETYMFKISPHALLFHEMCAFMAERGFGCVDVIDPLWRTYDGALWQMDLIFVPLTASEFKHPYFT